MHRVTLPHSNKGNRPRTPPWTLTLPPTLTCNRLPTPPSTPKPAHPPKVKHSPTSIPPRLSLVYLEMVPDRRSCRCRRRIHASGR